MPVTGDPNDGTPVKLYTIDIEHRPHALVVTSQEQLDQWGHGTPHVVAPTMSFVQTLPATVGLAVNPGGDLGLPFAADSVADLGPSERTLPAGTRLRIGDPAVESVEVLTQVAYALGEVSDVLGASRA